jgi:hypothetical protein
MALKIFISSILIILSITLTAQEKSNVKRQRSRLAFGANMNIPAKPTSLNYNLGYGILEQYEYLLGSHWTALESLTFNNLFGKNVNEFYENKNIDVKYEYFRTAGIQLGVGFYFGENQRTFFVLIKGGIAWYWSVKPSYPDVYSDAGNLIKPAIPREEVNGNFWFFDPKIGWQFNRAQIYFSYHGTVKQDSQINTFSLGAAYNVIKP